MPKTAGRAFFPIIVIAVITALIVGFFAWRATTGTEDSPASEASPEAGEAPVETPEGDAPEQPADEPADEAPAAETPTPTAPVNVEGSADEKEAALTIARLFVDENIPSADLPGILTEARLADPTLALTLKDYDRSKLYGATDLTGIVVSSTLPEEYFPDDEGAENWSVLVNAVMPGGGGSTRIMRIDTRRSTAFDVEGMEEMAADVYATAVALEVDDAYTTGPTLDTDSITQLYERSLEGLDAILHGDPDMDAAARETYLRERLLEPDRAFDFTPGMALNEMYALDPIVTSMYLNTQPDDPEPRMSFTGYYSDRVISSRHPSWAVDVQMRWTDDGWKPVDMLDPVKIDSTPDDGD